MILEKERRMLFGRGVVVVADGLRLLAALV